MQSSANLGWDVKEDEHSLEHLNLGDTNWSAIIHDSNLVKCFTIPVLKFRCERDVRQNLPWVGRTFASIVFRFCRNSSRTSCTCTQCGLHHPRVEVVQPPHPFPLQFQWLARIHCKAQGIFHWKVVLVLPLSSWTTAIIWVSLVCGSLRYCCWWACQATDSKAFQSPLHGRICATNWFHCRTCFLSFIAFWSFK